MKYKCYRIYYHKPYYKCRYQYLPIYNTSKNYSIKKIIVSGKVQPRSVLIAAIRVKVKRKNGHKDYYYKIAVFDNSKSDHVLKVRKTFSIPIYPKTKKRDKIKVELFTSYKD